MTHVVFGGAGFIGTHLSRRLVHAGKQVVCADIAPPSQPVTGAVYVNCDVRQPVALDIDEPDVIYNLAGLVTTPGHAAADYYATNVEGALNVCRFAARTRGRRLLFTSSMSVYPTGEELKTEKSRVAPINAYGHSKWIAERLHGDWAKRHPDRQLVISRPAVVFGAGERGNFARLRRLVHRRAFVYPGRRDTIKACGFVEDLLDSFDFALDREEPYYLYNFAYRERLTISDLVNLIATELNCPTPRFTLPSGAMNAAAAPFEGLEHFGLRTGINRARLRKLVESTNLYPELLLAGGFQFGTTPQQGIARWLATPGHDAITRR